MSKEENIAHQIIGAGIGTSRDYESFRQVFAEDFIDHDAAEGQLPGVAGTIQYWRAFGEAFPDWQIDADVFLADDDYVTLAYRLSGTHQGVYLGHAPTGKHFEVRSLQIDRFENGLIVERWGSTDVLGILTQLGLAS